MSLSASYDPNNIFAKIIRGDMPCTKLYETDDILAFMDVFPQSEGHCLVIHKHATATNLFDIDTGDLSTLIAAVQKTAGAVKAGLNPSGVRVIQFNGEAAGQTVFHIHFHVIPIYEGAAPKGHATGSPADAGDLEKTAQKIRHFL